jgi:hypothetical protein
VALVLLKNSKCYYQLKHAAPTLSDKQVRYFEKFRTNLLNGIAFYKKLLTSFTTNAVNALEELCAFEKELLAISF